MIEADLQLKLEMRSIKEQFLLLLENFAQFEQCHMDPGADIVVNRGAMFYPNQQEQKFYGSGYDAPQVSMCSPQNSTNDISVSQDFSRDDGKMKFTRSTASSSAFYPFRSSRHKLKKKRKKYEEHNLTNISEITRCSEMSIREQNSRCAESGPLQSTFQYPQHSTPEKKSDQSIASALDEQSAVHKLTLLDGTQRPPANKIDSRMEPPPTSVGTSLEVRPAPTGLDNAHFGQLPQSSAAQALLDKAPVEYPNTPDDNTPIIRRALQANPNFNHLLNNSNSNDSSNSPTLVADDSTPTCSATRTPKVSRELFLQTEETFSMPPRRARGTSESSDSSTGSSGSAKLRRQTAQQNLSDGSHTAPAGLSDTDLGEPASLIQDSTLANTQFSVEATRASEADTSGLSNILLSDGDDTSDVDSRSSDDAMSTPPFNSCTESSYKESDGQWSPGRSVTTGSSVSMPDPVQFNQRKLGPLSSGTNSMASLSSDRAGMRAPVNSPNATDISTSSKPATIDSADFSDTVSSKRPESLGASVLRSPPYILGTRPPCIGDEMLTPKNSNILSSASSLSPPSTVKKRPLKRTSSLTSPKAEPMITVDPKALTDCDTSSDKSASTSGYTSKSSEFTEVLSNSGNQSAAPRGTEVSQAAVPKSPGKKSKRRLSQKLQSLKNRFRRKSTAKSSDA